VSGERSVSAALRASASELLLIQELPLNQILFRHAKQERMPGNQFGSKDCALPVDLTF
jgi:hypothetical protein